MYGLLVHFGSLVIILLSEIDIPFTQKVFIGDILRTDRLERRKRKH